MNKLVAIVGRPNVGKSTLFNRMTETYDAIVDSESGVTRDRKYGSVDWCGKEFNVIDTGGLTTDSEDSFEKVIKEQILISLEESSLVLFMVDVTTGITDLDLELANILRKSDKEVIVVSNKVDTSNKENDSFEFYKLGLSEKLFSISANNGYGTGDLLDEIVEVLGDEEIEEVPDVPKIAVVGKPNVGKSTFVNTILDDDRNIVTDIAGTTRDSIDTRFQAFGFDFIITDTAGLRRKRSIDDQIEFYSTIRTAKSIEQSDVCILLIDASKGLTKQDLNIFYQIVDQKKGVVIAVNKWDLIEKDGKTHGEFYDMIKSSLAPFNDVPIIFTSNVTKQRILKTLEVAIEVYENRRKKVPTSKLNEVLLDIIDSNPPPAIKGKYVRIKYVTQIPAKYPAIAFFCNLPQYIKDPYRRFLENKLRENFDYKGVPIKIYFRKK